jgi:heptosyltransferase-2
MSVTKGGHTGSEHRPSQQAEVLTRKLVIAPAWVGDMVMAQSLFMTLKEIDPSVPVDLVAPPATLALAQRMPQIDQTYVLHSGHGQLSLGERFRLGKSLRHRGYQQAFILPNSFKSALVPWVAKIPVRTGWKGEYRIGLLNDLRHLDKDQLPRMVERFCALARGDGNPAGLPIPTPALTVDRQNLSRLVDANQLQVSGSILALCPGAEYGPAKQWPADYFARLAEANIDRKGQAWIFGSSADREIARQIVQGIPGEKRRYCVDLTGKTSLLDAIDLLSITSMVVTNDSGLMHVAAALQRRLLVIYGSTSPAFTPPLSDTAQIISLELSCSPCFQRRCPLGHTNCLNQLNPETVIQFLDKEHSQNDQ